DVAKADREVVRRREHLDGVARAIADDERVGERPAGVDVDGRRAHLLLRSARRKGRRRDRSPTWRRASPRGGRAVGFLHSAAKARPAMAGARPGTGYGDQYFRTTPRFETGDERYACPTT